MSRFSPITTSTTSASLEDNALRVRAGFGPKLKARQKGGFGQLLIREGLDYLGDALSRSPSSRMLLPMGLGAPYVPPPPTSQRTDDTVGSGTTGSLSTTGGSGTTTGGSGTGTSGLGTTATSPGTDQTDGSTSGLTTTDPGSTGGWTGFTYTIISGQTTFTGTWFTPPTDGGTTINTPTSGTGTSDTDVGTSGVTDTFGPSDITIIETVIVPE